MNVQVNLANMEASALTELTATRAIVLEDTRELHVEQVSRLQVYHPINFDQGTYPYFIFD